MPVSDQMFSFASKRVTKWSKTRLPRGWFAFQVLVATALFIWIGWGILTGDTATSTSTTLTSGIAGTTGQPGQGTPAAPATTPAATTAPTAVPDEGDGAATLAVTDVAGNSVQVPAPAAELASAALRGMFDTATATLVPIAGGGTMPAPVRDFPAATVGDLTLVAQSSDATQFTFVATTDADGSGATFSGVATQVVVANSSGSWVIARG